MAAATLNPGAATRELQTECFGTSELRWPPLASIPRRRLEVVPPYLHGQKLQWTRRCGNTFPIGPLLSQHNLTLPRRRNAHTYSSTQTQTHNGNKEVCLIILCLPCALPSYFSLHTIHFPIAFQLSLSPRPRCGAAAAAAAAPHLPFLSPNLRQFSF